MFNINGLPGWSEGQIELREQTITNIHRHVKSILLRTNPAWHMMRVETPLLMPDTMISNSYSTDEYYSVGEGLALRPETTAGSYEFIKKLFDNQPMKWQKPPICIWQSGKSFRKEQDQPSKYCRFKEFYQLEFQCIYNKDSKCDYHTELVEGLGKAFLNSRTVASDRLPAYSAITTDIELPYKGRWMEIASISKRTDFDNKHDVVEVAFGLDRLVLTAGVK